MVKYLLIILCTLNSLVYANGIYPFAIYVRLLNTKYGNIENPQIATYNYACNSSISFGINGVSNVILENGAGVGLDIGFSAKNFNNELECDIHDVHDNKRYSTFFSMKDLKVTFYSNGYQECVINQQIGTSRMTYNDVTYYDRLIGQYMNITIPCGGDSDFVYHLLPAAPSKNGYTSGFVTIFHK